VVHQPNDRAVLQRQHSGDFDRLAGVLVDDLEDIFQAGCPRRLVLRPAGLGHGYGVGQCDPPFGVGGEMTASPMLPSVTQHRS